MKEGPACQARRPMHLIAPILLLLWVPALTSPESCAVERIEGRERAVDRGDLFEELRPDFAFAHVAGQAEQRVRFAEAHPACFNALYNAAAALQGQMQQAAAATFWSRALLVKNRHVGPELESETEYRFAVALHSLGDEMGAAEALVRAIMSWPLLSRAWLRLGLVLHGKAGHGPRSAARALLAALRLQRGSARSSQRDGNYSSEVLYFILQETLRQSGQDELASGIAREAVRRNPRSPELFCRMFVAAVSIALRP